MSPTSAHRGRGEPGDDERVELEVLPGEERPEDERPERGTEERAEEDVRDRPRLARLGGYMSATAVRARSTAPFIAPTPRKPRITSGAESTTQPSAVSTQPTVPTTKPPAMTGTRP